MKRAIAYLVDARVRELTMLLAVAKQDQLMWFRSWQRLSKTLVDVRAELMDVRSQLAYAHKQTEEQRLLYDGARREVEHLTAGRDAAREELQFLRDNAPRSVGDIVRDHSDAVATAPPAAVLTGRERANLLRLSDENADLRARLEKCGREHR